MNGLDEFLASYIETAFWSSPGEKEEFMSSEDSDLAEETIQLMRTDCESFEKQANQLIEAYRSLPDADAAQSNYSECRDRIAHDFWLTRNHHGAGFWDGDYPEPLATQLTDLAKTFKEVVLYIGDDSKIYQY